MRWALGQHTDQGGLSWPHGYGSNESKTFTILLDEPQHLGQESAVHPTYVQNHQCPLLTWYSSRSSQCIWYLRHCPMPPSPSSLPAGELQPKDVPADLVVMVTYIPSSAHSTQAPRVGKEIGCCDCPGSETLFLEQYPERQPHGRAESPVGDSVDTLARAKAETKWPGASYSTSGHPIWTPVQVLTASEPASW